MVFSSLTFLTLFLPLTTALYYLLPGREKNILLLVASLLFYAWGEPKHIFLMLITTVYIWLLSMLMEQCKHSRKTYLSKLLLFLCLVFSLGTLAFYKYFGFLLDNLPFLQNTAVAAFRPALPVGISFYTFQALSYAIDVYNGTVKAQKRWSSFAMYISLFPQLIAGPIVRYADVEAQLEQRQHSIEKIYAGIFRFTVGLGKKLLLANQIGMLWDEISGMGSLSMLSAWLGAIAFTLQIYFDFSAYSDMAIGLGKIFGFDFTENFLYPYQAKSITEFWRRWHITLGTWFREYVYIPLGGNRRGGTRLFLNLFAVWSLTGLWHGADWQFLFWGLYYFLFLALEKFILLPWMNKWPSPVRRIYTLVIVVVGWVMFACEDIEVAGTFYKAMFGVGVPFANRAAFFCLTDYLLLLVISFVGCTEYPKRWVRSFCEKLGTVASAWLSWGTVMVTLCVSIAFLAADSYNPFLYFRF